ncbi:MAG: DUF6361 family protein [Bacteroidota bacterium]|jgi:hypothetical protein
MASIFNWLDYSEHERRKMLDVINLFHEQDTRDELGLANIRDTYADLLFPGTGTVQTRAKYFLFIPWMYSELERKRIGFREITAAARKKEIELINVLIRSDEKDGIIGIEARENLLRLPSNIYWLGLGVWGIRLFDGSQDQYHRSLDSYYNMLNQKIKREADDSDDSISKQNWNPNIPSVPSSFPTKTSLKLNLKEARFLQEQILTQIPGTMLAEMVGTKKIYDGVDFPWEYPGNGLLSATTKEILVHARNFSELMHGAPLLYNLMLAEKAQKNRVAINQENRWSDLVRDYQEAVAGWFKEIKVRKEIFAGWDREAFWHIVFKNGIRVSPRTRRFIDTWIDLALSEKTAGKILVNQIARRLVQDRESDIKKGQARLSNLRALEKWNGAAGIRQMTYRWSNVQIIVKDIQAGLIGKDK